MSVSALILYLLIFQLISAVLLATITVNYGAILKPLSHTVSNDFNTEKDGSYNFQ